MRMNNSTRGMSIILAGFLLLVVSTSAYPIGIGITGTSGGILEDVILITSEAGLPTRDVVILGDLDLSAEGFVFDVEVDAETTHWWLIGHESGDVVYSSNQDLLGVDMYDVEPYDIEGAELAWNIPANLDAYVNGGAYSFDWWAQTINNHSSHVAADGASATLWLFSSPGSEYGTAAVNIHTNEIPGDGNGNGPGPGPVVPEPATMALVSLGLLGLGIRGRKMSRK